VRSQIQLDWIESIQLIGLDWILLLNFQSRVQPTIDNAIHRTPTSLPPPITTWSTPTLKYFFFYFLALNTRY
jgi:hypothetical protein